MEQEASSQSPLAGDSAFSYWPPQLLLLLLNSCCCCCQGTRCCSCRANGSVAASCPLLPLLPLPPAFFFFFPRVPGGEAGAFSSPTGGGARLAERPLRFGPYSRALVTATAPPPGNSPFAAGEWQMCRAAAASGPAWTWAPAPAAAPAAPVLLPLLPLLLLLLLLPL
jgi:hypothetical protein